MQLAPQTVDKLQNAAGFGFDNRLHDQLATAIEDSDPHRFLVHVHADILDVATHAVASLRERSFALNGALSLKVKCHSSAHLPIFSSDSCPKSRFTPLHPCPLSHNALIQVVGVIASSPPFTLRKAPIVLTRPHCIHTSTLMPVTLARKALIPRR